jgi:hypothetical protein
VRIVNRKPFTDFGHLILCEDSSLASPVSVLNFSRYQETDRIIDEMRELKDEIQCVVSAADIDLPHVYPGFAQKPELDDYADGVDTIRFLLE